MSSTTVEHALQAPTAERGSALLTLAEDQWFDRKSARISPRDLADTMVAFANAEGGTVVLGLWNGVVEGVGRAGSAKQSAWRQAAADYTQPPVSATVRVVGCVNEEGQGDELLAVQVDSSPQRVHSNVRSQVLLRIGDEDRRLTFDQVQELTFDKGQSAYETSPVAGAERGDLNPELVDEYADLVAHPDPDRLLSARGLATGDGALTVAGVLLFARTPQRWFPEASMRVLRYRGSERGTGARQQVLHDLRLEGPIPAQLSEAQRAIHELVPTRQALGVGGRFERIGLIPRDAWLEALVNAAIHRSYSIGGDHIRVEIFDDRVEVASPGRFPGVVSFSDPIDAMRFARNPRIARVCADLRFGQELGEGIRRMFEEMRLAGLADPSYTQTSGSVRVVLSSVLIDRELESRLPQGSRDLLRFVREAGRLSTGDLASATGISRPVVIRRLRALEESGLVEWVGNSAKDPRAYWKLPS